MAKDKSKDKTKDKTKGGPKHVHARLSYLQKAATYLTTQAGQSHTSAQAQALSDPPGEQPYISNKTDGMTTTTASIGAEREQRPGLAHVDHHAPTGLPPYLTNHLMQVSRKMQIRLSSDVKHNICKRCGNVLIDSQTSTRLTENLSTGGKKLHADVFVLECAYCGAQKRFPAGAMRQKKKSLRQSRKKAEEADVNKNAAPS